MKKLSVLAVAVLLALLAVSAQQPTQLKVSFDTADVEYGPLCTTATQVDCIFQARITKGTATVKTVPFSAFSVSGGIATATVAIASIPVGFGTNNFTAILDAKAADNSLVSSDVSVSVSVVRRPKAPGLVAQ